MRCWRSAAVSEIITVASQLQPVLATDTRMMRWHYLTLISSDGMGIEPNLNRTEPINVRKRTSEETVLSRLSNDCLQFRWKTWTCSSWFFTFQKSLLLFACELVHVSLNIHYRWLSDHQTFESSRTSSNRAKLNMANEWTKPE